MNQNQANVARAIMQLENPAEGHGILTMGYLSNAQNANGGSGFTACFNSESGQKPGVDEFAAMIKNAKAPSRLYVPMGLAGNHITAMIIDIDENNKADILFFNSLGHQAQGYFAAAKPFMSAVRARFPEGATLQTEKQFQILSRADNFCGDWSRWFLQQAAKGAPNRSLAAIKNVFDNITAGYF